MERWHKILLMGGRNGPGCIPGVVVRPGYASRGYLSTVTYQSTPFAPLIQRDYLHLYVIASVADIMTSASSSLGKAQILSAPRTGTNTL